MEERGRKRLGHYAEDLLTWWLQQHKAVQQFHHGVAIRETNPSGGQRTLGELDFCWFDADNSTIEHWELAVKFYICCGNNLGDYLGPNRKDSLERKWQRFTQHQLPLATTEAGQAALQDILPAATALHSRVLLKGWLFHPLQDGGFATHSTAPISPQHASGWWSEVAALSLPQRSRSSRYVAMPKARWLAPCLLPGGSSDVLSIEQAQRELGNTVNRQQQALLIAEIQRDLAGNWTELSRGFILPDGWSQSEVVFR
jgi:hypothetical protein